MGKLRKGKELAIWNIFWITAKSLVPLRMVPIVPQIMQILILGSNVELRNCFVKLMDVCNTSQSSERMHCQVCGKTFRLRAQLNAHLRSHSDEKPFKCDNCEKAFKYTWNLNKHKREHADKDVRLPFSCRFCGRAFASPDSLKKHLRLHKGNKPFRCLDCGKNFARHGHLMAHKNVHRRNIQCSVCWEVLPSIGDLRRKLKELFKCGLCQKAFVDSKALSEHCLTHMPGPSASKCQFCKRHFSSRAGLIRHIRLHTGEKPFPCPTC
uniref:Uncharacterized LOC107595368 n=1 Tax=Sinocyclocheilus grahami TaxID=75366 RepID=A0A672QTJ1_SINGR